MIPTIPDKVADRLPAVAFVLATPFLLAAWAVWWTITGLATLAFCVFVLGPMAPVLLVAKAVRFVWSIRSYTYTYRVIDSSGASNTFPIVTWSWRKRLAAKLGFAVMLLTLAVGGCRELPVVEPQADGTLAVDTAAVRQYLERAVTGPRAVYTIDERIRAAAALHQAAAMDRLTRALEEAAR